MCWPNPRIAVALLFFTLSCYTNSPNSSSPLDRGITLIVENETGVSVSVYERPNGHRMGTAMPGIDRLKLRWLSPNAETIYFKVVGDPNFYPSPPEKITSYQCWQVRIGVFRPGRDVYHTFLPCRE